MTQTAEPTVPTTTQEATERVVNLLDSKKHYEEADLDVTFNTAHLNTAQRNQLLLLFTRPRGIQELNLPTTQQQ
jgi:hypothetical protein